MLFCALLFLLLTITSAQENDIADCVANCQFDVPEHEAQCLNECNPSNKPECETFCKAYNKHNPTSTDVALPVCINNCVDNISTD